MPIAQFSGLASGIDSAALIDAIITAREQANKLREQEIDFYSSEKDALEELNTKLLALDDLVDRFRTANGGGVSKKTSSSTSTVATAIAGSDAVNTTTALTVTSTAKAATLSFNQTYASTSTVASTVGSGNVQIIVGNIGSPEATINVTVTQNVTTIQQLVNNINDAAGADGNINASLVNVGTTASPSYKIVLNTLNTGTDDGLITVNADVAITELQAATTSQATDASFSVSGISGSITRSSNNVNDLIPGLSFQILSTGSTNITVSNDADATADLMNEIVEAYNDIVNYVIENDFVQSEESGESVTNSFGSLAKTEVDDSFLTEFRLEFADVESENGVTVTSFAELGISTNRDGTLDIDLEEFKEKVAEDPTGAAEVLTTFADAVSGTGLIYQYTKFDGYIDISQSAADSKIEILQDAIDSLDRQNETLRETLEKRFARLETTMGRLQNSQTALSGLLAGL